MFHIDFEFIFIYIYFLTHLMKSKIVSDNLQQAGSNLETNYTLVYSLIYYLKENRANSKLSNTHIKKIVLFTKNYNIPL